MIINIKREYEQRVNFIMAASTVSFYTNEEAYNKTNIQESFQKLSFWNENFENFGWKFENFPFWRTLANAFAIPPNNQLEIAVSWSEIAIIFRS